MSADDDQTRPDAEPPDPDQPERDDDAAGEGEDAPDAGSSTTSARQSEVDFTPPGGDAEPAPEVPEPDEVVEFADDGPPPPPPPPPLPEGPRAEDSDGFPTLDTIAQFQRTVAEDEWVMDSPEDSSDARMSDASLPSFRMPGAEGEPDEPDDSSELILAARPLDLHPRRVSPSESVEPVEPPPPLEPPPLPGEQEEDEGRDPFGRLASDRFRAIEPDRALDHFGDGDSGDEIPEAVPASDTSMRAPGDGMGDDEDGGDGEADDQAEAGLPLSAPTGEVGASSASFESSESIGSPLDAGGDDSDDGSGDGAEGEPVRSEATTPTPGDESTGDDEQYFDPFSDDEFEYHPEHARARRDDDEIPDDPDRPREASDTAPATTGQPPLPPEAPPPTPEEPGTPAPPAPGVDPAVVAAASAETIDQDEVVPNLAELRARYRELTRAREDIDSANQTAEPAPDGTDASGGSAPVPPSGPDDETVEVPGGLPAGEIADSTLANEVQGLAALRARFRNQPPAAGAAIPPTQATRPDSAPAPPGERTDTDVKRAAERGAQLLGELQGRYRSAKFPTRAADLAEARMTLRVKEDQESSELPTLPEIREMTAPDEIHATIRFRSTKETPVQVPPHLRGAPPIIQVRDLKLAYGDTVVLDNLTFDIYPGEVFVILGGSGSGKSTLLKHMIRLYDAAAGTVEIDGEDIIKAEGDDLNRILRKIGVMYQLGALFGSMTLLQNVRLPLEEFTRLPKDAMDLIARMKLSLVGLEPYRNYYPAEISGGMQKRAAIARAMALDPRILFLDEPSAGLDPITSAELDDLIVTLARNLGITFVIVTHELPSIYAIADRAIMVDKRTRSIIAEGHPAELRDNSTDPFVRSFFHREAKSTAEEPSPS